MCLENGFEPVFSKNYFKVTNCDILNLNNQRLVHLKVFMYNNKKVLCWWGIPYKKNKTVEWPVTLSPFPPKGPSSLSDLGRLQPNLCDGHPAHNCVSPNLIRRREIQIRPSWVQKEIKNISFLDTIWVFSSPSTVQDITLLERISSELTHKVHCGKGRVKSTIRIAESEAYCMWKLPEQRLENIHILLINRIQSMIFWYLIDYYVIFLIV